MKKIFTTAIVFSILLSAKAQFTYDYLKAADEYFRKADYFSAAQYYEKYLGINGTVKGNEYDPYVIKASSNTEKTPVSNREQAIYNIAESYRQLKYYIKAEPYYKQAVSFDNSKFPLASYHYGTTLRALGKFQEAENSFSRFLSEYTTQDKYTEAANREIKNLQFIMAEMNKKDLNLYNIKASDAFTSEGANYAPVWVGTSSIYFTTTRPDATSAKKEHINKIYEAFFSNNSFGTPVKVNINQPSEVHQGGATVTADGSTMFLTRWMVGEGQKTAGIYISKRSGTGWSEPMPVQGLAATTAANDKQPFIMPDGKLMFASDRSGGHGGFDLWMATVSNTGEATSVINLGKTINTEFDEEAPYYHQSSNTLVFATNGRVGMGGFDLFHSKNQNGTWGSPENFGYPINSIKNDIYFTSRGSAKNILEDVLLSSDRNVDCCLQMFAASKTIKPKLIAGTVVDCRTNTPLTGAVVEVRGAGNQVVFSGSTTTRGTYNFTLEEFQALQITGSFPGYTTNIIRADRPADDALENLTTPILCLNKIPEVGTIEVIENVYFAYNKATILDESKASLDNLVKMLNATPSVSVEIGGHTDNIGGDTYNQKLSEARAQSVVKYLINAGIDPERLSSKGYGETRPVAPNTNPDGSDNPEGRAKNRRTEFKVIKN